MINLLRASRLVASKSSNRERRGVTAIEFALLAPVLFTFLIGIVEVSLMLLAQHLLENATYNASRTAKTGYVAASKTQLETVTEVLHSRLSGLAPLLDPTKVSITYTTYANLSNIGVTGQGTESLGTASQIVVYTVSYPWKIFTPIMSSALGHDDGTLTLTSRIVVRNEPYD